MINTILKLNTDKNYGADQLQEFYIIQDFYKADAFGSIFKMVYF